MGIDLLLDRGDEVRDTAESVAPNPLLGEGPEEPLVLSLDEKSQIQAFDRTQPGLPMKRGRAGTITHDYKRNGTVTLFAAMCTLTGYVIRCMPRHRNQEYLKFLRAIDARFRRLSTTSSPCVSEVVASPELPTRGRGEIHGEVLGEVPG